MDQLLNELSISGGHANKWHADAAMRNLCQAVRKMAKYGYRLLLRMPQDAMGRFLAPRYTLKDWCFDKNFDEVHRKFILGMCQNSPHLEDLYEKEVGQSGEQYMVGENEAVGLAIAHLRQVPALSLKDPGHEGTCSALLRKRVLEDINGNVLCVDTLFSVPLIETPDDVDSHEEAVKAGVAEPKCANGEDILVRAESLFPHLIFCENARKQLVRLNGTEHFFAEILSHLELLERNIVEYGGGTFIPLGLDCAMRESETTMKNPLCRQERIFLCPDGINRVFWPHTKIHEENKRIHFFPDLPQRRIFIGYVGEHLRISGS